MIYRLQVELIAGMYMPERKVTRTLDVAGSCNLEKLCIDILNSIDFDFDHMYEFTFPGGRVFEGVPDLRSKSVCRGTKLYSLGLKEKDIFRLVYDFGDDWMFNIRVKEMIDKPGSETVVVRRVGTVEQYPDYDEWDEEYDEDWDDEDLVGEEWYDEPYYDDDDFTDQITFEYTAPDRLFDIAFQYKKAKLWTKLWSNEIIAIKFSDGQTGYLCVMGRDGQHCALGVYIGEEGLSSYRELYFGESRDNPYEEQERILTQNCLQLVLDNKEFLQDSEIDAAADYAKRNGMKLSGKNAYPHFVKYTPNHYPWHPIVDTDEGYIYEAAKAAIFLAEQLKGRKPSNFGIESFTAATRQLPCLVISGEKVSFGELITVPNPVPQPYTSPTPSNEVLIKKVKKLKRKNTVLCRLVRIPEPVMSEDESAPYYPLIIMSVDEKTGNAYPPEILHCYDENPEEAANMYLTNLEEMEFLPKKIKVSDERTYAFLSFMSKELAVDISMEKELPQLDECADNLINAMMAGNPGDDQSDYEMMISIAKEIVDMPKGAISTMPKELKAEIKQLIRAGILPKDLADKLSKKIGM